MAINCGSVGPSMGTTTSGTGRDLRSISRGVEGCRDRLVGRPTAVLIDHSLHRVRHLQRISEELWVCQWFGGLGCLVLTEVSKSMNMRQK
jgi:hypothetical protein